MSAGGDHAPNYLPGLGSWWEAEKFYLIVCKDCGFTRFFARPEARTKLSNSKKWKSL